MKNRPLITILIGNTVIGYTLNFFMRSLPPISCDFDFDIYTIILYYLLYFISAIFSPFIIKNNKFLRGCNIEYLSKLTSYLSIFSWIPLILSSTNILHLFSFGKLSFIVSSMLFGASSGLLQSFLQFFSLIKPLFKNSEECTSIINIGFFIGLFISEFILFLTNWQMSSFLGFYISYYYYYLLMKLFEEQKDGKDNYQLPAVIQMSIDITSVKASKGNSYCESNCSFFFLLLFIKYFSGKCFFDQYLADFAFELNYSQLVLDFIFVISSILSFYFSKYFRIQQTWPFTSTLSIISIFILTYFDIHQNDYNWNLTQLILVVSLIIWSFMYTLNFMMIPFVKISELLKRSSFTIQKAFTFSSYDWTMRLVSHSFFYLILNYISIEKNKMIIICLMTFVCSSIGFFAIKKRNEIIDDIEQSIPLRNL